MPEVETILVTGSNGQLGRSLKKVASRYTEYEFVFATREDFDLCDTDSITRYFENNKFDVMINCAAYTAVDGAESEPETANQVNNLAVKQLAEFALNQGAKFIHISTDYVFNGNQDEPYNEIDNVEPHSVYGTTKLRGEEALLQTMDSNAIILRTSWVYSEYGNNFVKTMLKLGKQRDAINVIFDQIGTPTYAHDLAIAIMTIVNSEQFNQATFESEIYHYSNEGLCSWYDFALAIFELSKITCDVKPIETKDYPTLAARPHYSLLNKEKFKNAYGVMIPHWKDSLKACLTQLQD